METGTVNWLNECVERGKREVFSQAVILNPGLAAELLKRNPDNRNIRQTKVLQYEADMRAGRWTFNGEPIIVSKDGLINDGQHRLRAMVEANCTIPILFVFGLERETRLTVDQGALRTAGDFLGMEGVENATVCAAIARMMIAIERERWARLYRPNDVPTAEIRLRVGSDPDVAAAANYAVGNAKFTKAFCVPAIVGVAYYMLHTVNSVDARIFMDQVCVGEGLNRESPAYASRDALLSLGRGMQGARLEVIFRGWVAHREGRPLKIAKVLGHFPELD